MTRNQEIFDCRYFYCHNRVSEILTISIPASDGGRKVIDIYPKDYEDSYDDRIICGLFHEEKYPDELKNLDPDGQRGFKYGCMYYSEGMSYTDSKDHQKRIDCFKAAEILFSYASFDCHNIQAFVNLGYIYFYDRCEGYYRERPPQDYIDEMHSNYRYPHENSAFQCFEIATRRSNHPQAYYKLGDILFDEEKLKNVEEKRLNKFLEQNNFKNSKEAIISMYKKAYEYSEQYDSFIWGSAALRLGEIYECGKCDVQSFKDACYWYNIAETGLKIAVDAGEYYYKKSYIKAKNGKKRAIQELDGTY